MASPINFYIIPNSGLQINADIKSCSENDVDPIAYTITNDEKLQVASHAKGRVFSGFMSPIHQVTLPRTIRQMTGIHEDAAFFSFLHPPTNLADAIDWGTWHKDNDSKLQSMAKDNASEVDLKIENEWAMPVVALMGAYVYFDTNRDLLSVNVISLLQTCFDLRLSGPFATQPDAAKYARRSNRAQPLILDYFHEIDYVASAWIRPTETLRYKAPIDGEIHFLHGGFIFYRDDGSNIMYAIENTGYIDPCGNISSLADAFQATENRDKLLYHGRLGFSVNDCLSLDLYKTRNDISKIARVPMKKKEYIASLVDDKTLIHKACHADCSFEVIEILLKGGEAKNLSHKAKPYEWTPLMYACRYKSNDRKLIISLIRKHPESITEKDKLNRTALHIAVSSEASPDIIRLLIDSDAYGRNIFQPTKYLGKLPIHIACLKRRVSADVIRDLLRSDREGKTLHERTKADRLPLHIAIQRKMRTEILRILLDTVQEHTFDHRIIDGSVELELNPVEQDIQTSRTATVYEKFDGVLPLHIACWNNCPADTIQLLLDKDEENSTVSEGVNPLSWLVIKVDLLDAKEKKDFNSTILEKPLSKRSSSVLRKMSTSTFESDGAEKRTVALHLAAAHGNKDVIDLLLQKDGSCSSTVKLLDSSGRFPIHIACQAKNTSPAVIQQLLESDRRKETIHGQDDMNYKAIHYACERKDPDHRILELLLKAEEQKIATSTDTDKRMAQSCDNRGRSPLYLAVQHGASDDVVEILLKPENFNLKGFDHRLLTGLANISAKNPKIQDLIIEKLAERCYFNLLFLDLYTNTCALVFFLRGSEKLLKKQPCVAEPPILTICLLFFIFRTALHFKSEPGRFFSKIWSLCQVSYMILLALVVDSMVKSNGEDVPEMNIYIFIVTCALLVANLTYFLKATFLPFARFVGGLLMIFNTLIPFFIVSGLLLLAFAYGFRLSEPDACDSMYQCYALTLQGIFSGAEETSDALDVLFGIIAIVVLLNVLIAIVSDAWDSAADRADNLFWRFRLEFLSEARILSKIHNRFCESNVLVQINKYFDTINDIKFMDKTYWTKMPFSLVQKKKQYDDPHGYFTKKVADQIMHAHSLQADLYWVSNDHRNKEADGESRLGIRWMKIITIAKWLMRCFIYLLLMLCGFVTSGYTWSNSLRRYLLAYGQTSKYIKAKYLKIDEQTPKTVTGVNADSTSATYDDEKENLLELVMNSNKVLKQIANNMAEVKRDDEESKIQNKLTIETPQPNQKIKEEF